MAPAGRAQPHAHGSRGADALRRPSSLLGDARRARRRRVRRARASRARRCCSELRHARRRARPRAGGRRRDRLVDGDYLFFTPGLVFDAGDGRGRQRAGAAAIGRARPVRDGPRVPQLHRASRATRRRSSADGDYARLHAVRAAVDPAGLMVANHPIPPAEAAGASLPRRRRETSARPPASARRTRGGATVRRRSERGVEARDVALRAARRARLGDRLGGLLGRAEQPARAAPLDQLALREALGRDEARHHGADVDAVRALLGAQAVAPDGERGLGGRVGAGAGAPDATGGAGDVDDRARRRRAQQRQQRLCQPDLGVEVDLHRRAGRSRSRSRRTRRARRRPALLTSRSSHRRAAARRAHVRARARLRRSGRARAPWRARAARRRAARAGRRGARAARARAGLLREPPRGRLAEPARRAGDQGDRHGAGCYGTGLVSSQGAQRGPVFFARLPRRVAAFGYGGHRRVVRRLWRGAAAGRGSSVHLYVPWPGEMHSRRSRAARGSVGGGELPALTASVKAAARQAGVRAPADANRAAGPPASVERPADESLGTSNVRSRIWRVAASVERPSDEPLGASNVRSRLWRVAVRVECPSDKPLGESN